jgi:hypothetical protein
MEALEFQWELLDANLGKKAAWMGIAMSHYLLLEKDLMYH